MLIIKLSAIVMLGKRMLCERESHQIFTDVVTFLRQKIKIVIKQFFSPKLSIVKKYFIIFYAFQIRLNLLVFFFLALFSFKNLKCLWLNVSDWKRDLKLKRNVERIKLPAHVN